MKQGGCLSPLLFTLYLDGLIHVVILAEPTCGIFGYADNLAIVSATLFGQRQMIVMCE